MDNVDERILRKIYSEIVVGYSIAIFNSEIVYIKHPNNITLLEFDFKYQQKYSKFLADGVASEKEKINLLIRDGLWSEKKEQQITDIRSTIDQLYTSKRNHYSLREINAYNEQIKTNQGFLLELLTERMSLIGNSAELMARRILDTEQIVSSFFKDDELKHKVFGGVEDISDDQLDSIFSLYEQFTKNTSDSMIRRLSVSNDFQSIFNLTDNLYYFYGRAVSQLTHYQSRLAQYGNYFKTILNNDPKPPDQIRNDPEALEDWFFARTNIQKTMDKDEAEGKSTSFFGMSRKELQYLGVEIEAGSQMQLSRIADKNGEISMSELKKHGHI